jgi:excisionase family DNA binding protein
MKKNISVIDIGSFLFPRKRKGKKGMNDQSKRKYLTTEEAAAILRQKPRTITAWANAYKESGGKEGLRGCQPGRKWLFDEADVMAMLETKTSKVA